MKKNGYNQIELIVVVGVFTIVYFVGAFIVSKNFNVDFEMDLYNQKIAAIEKQAEIYGEKEKDLFKESDSVYVTIEELALANAIVSTKEGVVADPRNSSDTLNNLKVKITKEDDKVTAKVLG